MTDLLARAYCLGVERDARLHLTVGLEVEVEAEQYLALRGYGVAISDAIVVLASRSKPGTAWA